ncbi:MAG: nicotinamide riboside transporter PnuC [Bacteroidaceae bacterium]|nr:nicotinamide riboside transporter PnuC [Bacteroidaceae bacterium]
MIEYWIEYWIEYLTDNWLEILGTLIGIIYLWLELKANIYMWIAGIIMPAISIFVYYDAGLYADFGINVYYLIAAIYGFAVWTMKDKHAKTKNKELPITYTPKSMYAILLATFVLAFLAIGFILVNFTDSNVPWWDSFTTALSIVGMWMLARKWIEQWWTWIAVDAVCCGLYIYKGIFFYSALYGLYTIIAIYGYFEWKKIMQKQ